MVTGGHLVPESPVGQVVLRTLAGRPRRTV